MATSGGNEGHEGFALDAYTTPRHGPQQASPAYMVPKASRDVGGMLEQVQRAAKNPGPEQYNRDFLDKEFCARLKGGRFGTLARDFPKLSNKTPAVGQYETTSSITSPKIKGGPLPKHSRGCYLYDLAVKQSKVLQSPGQYENTPLKMHVYSPCFTTAKTESKNPQKPSQVGPGYYDLNFGSVQKRSIAYTASKEASKTFPESHVKGKAALPAPGHAGIPDSKVQDRLGQAKHAARLLGDRIVTPRGAPPLGSVASPPAADESS